MGDIAQRGNRLTFARGGRAGFQDGGSPHTKDKQKSPKKKFITGFGSKGKSRTPVRQVDPSHRGYKKGGRIGKFGGGRTNLLEELGRVEAERSNPNRRAEISRVHGELNRGYAKGGRIGLKHGGKPWGTGPKPGTIEFFQSTTQTPKRKRKAVGGVARGAQKAADTFTEKVGGSEKGKPHSTKEGRIASGKRKISRFLQSRALKKEAGPQAPSRPKRTWPPKHKDLMRRFPKRNPHRDFADIIKDKTVPNPRRKPGEKREYQPAATGGRMGFKKGTDKKWMQKVSASIKKRGTKGKCTPITKPGCTGRAKALAKTFKKIAAKNKKA